MTIAVDWDIKLQINQTQSSVNALFWFGWKLRRPAAHLFSFISLSRSFGAMDVLVYVPFLLWSIRGQTDAFGE